MKKQILLLTSIIISTLSFAQQKTSVNIQAGLTSASIRGDAANSLKDILEYTNGYINTNNRMGFYAGASVSIPLTELMSIEPGLQYTQRGYEMKGSLNLKGVEFLGANAKAQLTSHYVDLPVVLKANIGGLQLFAGPQVSYLAKADLRTTAGALGINFFDRTMDATEKMNRWDAGLTGGVGYLFKNGLNINAAYDHGLMKADANENTDAYNQTFKAGLGLRF